MKQFISILVAGLVLIVFLNSVIHVANLQQAAIEPAELTDMDESHELYAVIKKAHQLSTAKDYLSALTLLEQNESAFNILPSSQRQMRYEYHQIRGHCHAALWQYVDAEVMWQRAGEDAIRADDKKRMRDLIQFSTRAIDDMNQERYFKEAYHASPNIGPAAALRGRVVLIYVFVADDSLYEWSLRQRSHALNSWHLAQEWLSVRAKGYGSELSFTQRIFVINKHPIIKRLRVGDHKANFKHADAVASMVASHLGYSSILDFIHHIKTEEKADQALLMYHIARDGRSFASRCLHRCDELGEFVFLMEAPNVKHWQSLRYAQAHESLHVFGADDLYNVSKAKYYAVRDIMNYPSSILDASTLEDLTAFSVGLRDHRPATPFNVITYSARK